MHYAADLAAIRDAAARIAGRARRTPVATCTMLDQLAGRSLFFKCEQYQKSGSFKFRGACNAVMKLSDADAARGVAPTRGVDAAHRKLLGVAIGTCAVRATVRCQ